MQRSPCPLLFAALLPGLLVLAGCQRPPAPPEPEQAEREDEAQAEAVTCDPVERPPLQAGEHLIGDRGPPVPYSSTPPTSGWHASGAFDIAIHDPGDPLPEPRQVSVLESGGVVVTYRDLAGADRGELEGLVRDRYSDRVALTPYDELEPGHVAMTAWGVLQHCDGLDLDVVSAFIEEHADAEPHPPGH